MSSVINNIEIMDLKKVTDINQSDKLVKILKNNLYLITTKDNTIHVISLKDFKITAKF
jgi:hypothetical protein